MKLAYTLLALLALCGLEGTVARHPKHHGNNRAIRNALKKPDKDECPHVLLKDPLDIFDLEWDKGCEPEELCVKNHCRVCTRGKTVFPNIGVCESDDERTEPDGVMDLSPSCVENLSWKDVRALLSGELPDCEPDIDPVPSVHDPECFSKATKLLLTKLNKYHLSAVKAPDCDLEADGDKCFAAESVKCHVCRLDGADDMFKGLDPCSPAPSTVKQVAMSANNKPSEHARFWNDATFKIAAVSGTAVGVALIAAVIVYRVKQRKRRHHALTETSVQDADKQDVDIAEMIDEETKEADSTVVEGSA